MLGWMLKRGEHASDADAGDTTQIDQPDTPAPVFAARAFKSALFGTPPPPSNKARSRRDKKAGRTAAMPDRGSGTPSKPPGILLTPGTGPSRRKRVSFDHDVPGGTKTGTRDEARGDGDSRPAEMPSRTAGEAGAARSKPDAHATTDDSEEEWEEEDDDGEFCTHDITLDLNEPHSQSGRYWKGEFEKYHREAKAEMEKLLKYKQLAKSYAQQKDAEAIQLAEKLRDEQQKVMDMEKKIAENASQIVSTHRRSDDEPAELLSKLSKQTALAAQYRHRVQELEDELDSFLRQRDGNPDVRGRRRRQAGTSPTTHKTLMEAQRELRRARTQLKDLDSLREEVSTLRARLRVAEAQANRRERNDVASGGPRARELRAQLERAKEESRKKDAEMAQLKSDFEAFRKESEMHETDTKAVLERAHAKISDLKKEIKTLRAAGADQHRPDARHARPGMGTKAADGPALQGTRDLGRSPGSGEEEAMDAAGLPSRTLRDKFRDGADAAHDASSGSTERPNLDKPRWQPFVPRSPRRRACLGDETSGRKRDGAAPAAGAPKAAAVPDLPALAQAVSRIGKAELSSDDGDIDLLQDRFARLGGPDVNSNSNHVGSSMPGNTSKASTLPPERRAAALARIEQRMAEKRRAQRRTGNDKENCRP